MSRGGDTEKTLNVLKLTNASKIGKIAYSLFRTEKVKLVPTCFLNRM